jgi:hypothetical protein
LRFPDLFPKASISGKDLGKTWQNFLFSFLKTVNQEKAKTTLSLRAIITQAGEKSIDD